MGTEGGRVRCSVVSKPKGKEETGRAHKGGHKKPRPMGSCPAERRAMSPFGTPIDGPRALASEGKDNSSGDPSPPAPLCTPQRGVATINSSPDPVRRNVGSACLFANPTNAGRARRGTAPRGSAASVRPAAWWP